MMDEYAKYLEEKKAKPKGLSTFKLKVIGDVLMFLCSYPACRAWLRHPCPIPLAPDASASALWM